MKNHKDISKHLDKLMELAESPNIISTSSGFEDRLNSQLDAIEAGKADAKARVLSLSTLQKYAALFLLLILNISVILIFSNDDETETDVPQTAQEYSDEYFPDYTLLTSLE